MLATSPAVVNESLNGVNRKETAMQTLVSRVAILAAAVTLTAGVNNAEAGPKGPSIVEVAVAVNSEGIYAGMFDTLIAALGAADPAVLETLAGNGQHTVFAPTDDAFAALELYPENIGDLDKDFLTEVLLYHVANGRRDSEEVVGSSKIRTLLGDFLQQEGGVLIDNVGQESVIIVVDVPAANGIIHVIDTVVLPYLP
jgi:uncharacterized surface protein with fasciclin (FAS1) repeats